jgi:hypothetical protein
MLAPETYSQSVYLPSSHRPYIPQRQRSTSLPPGLACMNTQEAVIIFSAAEKATARRRRIQSVDTPAWAESDANTSSEPTPMPSASTIKPSPLSQFMNSSGIHHAAEMAQNMTGQQPRRQTLQPMTVHISPPATPDLDASFPDDLDHSLPVSPRRQVASRSLKDYADGLFQFTQNRLTSTVPNVPVQALLQSIEITEEPVSSQLDKFPRPGLQSRFSDWSTVGMNSQAPTRDQSRRSSLATPPEVDIGLMSPNSFFGAGQATPKLGHSGASSARTFASSPTYDPPTKMPEATPPSRPVPVQVSNSEEFSYFANFDSFYNRESATGIDNEESTQSSEEQPEAMIIDLSPFEQTASASPMIPFQRRQRADTSILDPTYRRTCGSNKNTPGSGRNGSTPSTPFERGIQYAEVAVKIPHWLVGAIR